MTVRFHRIAVVDWSASSTPTTGPDSIWIGVLDTADRRVELSNPHTRAAAAEQLENLCRLPGAMLLGVDFSLGYPAGTAAALGLAGQPVGAMWSHLAELVDDDERNRNNRWRVAADLNRAIGAPQFWGAPITHAGPWLPTTRPAAPPLAQWRETEHVLRARGSRPFSVWQLLGVGSVGSQSLTGIPMLHGLRRRLPEGAVRVWPFDTGLTDDPLEGVDHESSHTVVAEVWPSSIDSRHVDHPVKDARQVIAMAHHLREQLDAGTASFASPAARAAGQRVLDEEGWVLGVM